ncbi:DUF2231 domain-containing protein [Actinoplanes sp. NPDC051470]|uniref:DUF2231 domain-containing protein n=1 Tax=unclassified Actinoplanes TaxID=2626549 RepID=UPI003430E75F
MESRLRIAGEAIHPVLIMFPLGLFTMAVLFDLANNLGAPAIIGQLAYWNILAGLIGGILVVLAAAIDVVFVRNGRAKRAGVLRNLMHMGVLIVFTVVLMLRMQSPDRVAGWGILAVEVLALTGSFYAAWFAGELANRRSVPALAPRRS